MDRRHFLSSLALLACAPALTSLAAPARTQSSAPLTPLRFSLDFRITSQTAPFFLALSKGYYREEGLDVTIDVGAGSVASITRVATGAYDLALGDPSSLIEFHARNRRNAPVRAVYQYYNSAPFVIIGRKDRGITDNFASLAGKRVAADTREDGLGMVREALVQQQIDRITQVFQLADKPGFTELYELSLLPAHDQRLVNA